MRGRAGSIGFARRVAKGSPVRLIRWMAVVGLVVASGLVPSPASAAGGGPIPVIYDSDMDFDDASTLAYLCEEHKLRRIELLAVTVANNGFGRPDRTLRHARSVLEQCGLPL